MRPIQVLPCFSKILERLRYNRLYYYLKENNIFYEKQFGFQSGYSTYDAIVFVKGIWYSWSFNLTEKIETLWHNWQKILRGLKVTYLIESSTFKYVKIA